MTRTSHSEPDRRSAVAGRRIVLVGNPNAGKSVVFGAMSGMYVDVSNYPGTTIEISQAPYGQDRLQDSPGVYGLGSFNDEERVARDVILQADILVNVVDAVHLERDLFLTLQLLELAKPMVVALNMMDEAASRGLKIDPARLEQQLGVPVIPTVAIRREGIDTLEAALDRARPGQVDPHWRVVLDELADAVAGRGEALLLLEGDRDVAARHPDLPVEAMREEIYQTRRRRADAVVESCVGPFTYRQQVRDRVSRLMLHPVSGALILLAVLWGMFEVVGVLVAGDLVGVTEGMLMQERYEPAVQGAVGRVVAPARYTVQPRGPLAERLDELAGSGDAAVARAAEEVLQAWDERLADQPWREGGTWREDVRALEQVLSPDAQQALRRLGAWDALVAPSGYYRTLRFPNDTLAGKAATVLAGEFGVLTHTVRYLVGLLLPLVLAFYLLLALLEDCGYLPRLATLTDRALNTIGLNGRAIIPIILGFGCVTMATITTRLLGTEREKSIAASILNFVIPCSAQLGVIVGILALAVAAAGGQAGPILLYVAVIFTILVLLGTLLDRLLPGRSSHLFIELPPLRLPRLGNVTKKTFVRSFAFMKEAAPWFVVGSLAVGLMQVTGLLTAARDALAPLTERWLLLTREAADVFIMGLVRRDFGAAGLTRLAHQGTLTPYQMTVSLIVVTLFVPCIASLLILVKERGVRQAAAIWVGTWLTAFTVGGLVAQALRVAGML